MRAMKQERQKLQVKGFNKDSDETATKYESNEARVVEAAGKMI